MLITCPKCSVKYKIPSEIKLIEGKKMQCSACGHVFEFVSQTKEELAEIEPLLPPEDAVLSVTTKTEEVTIRMPEPEKTPSPDTPAILPEAFQPVPEQRTFSITPYFWIMLCGIVLMGLVFIGWIYHDSFLKDVYAPQPLVREKVRPVKKNKRVNVSIQNQEKAIRHSATQDIPLDFSEVLPPLKEEASPPSESPVVLHSHPTLSVQSVRFRKTPTNEAILIEGSLKNTSSETVILPEKVYALAYGADGTILFEKEIYLSAGVLSPESEQAFFGTYTPAMEGIQWIDVVLEK